MYGKAENQEFGVLDELDVEELAGGVAWYHAAKRPLDLVVAIVLLALLWPVILVAAAIVKWTSEGPAFYVQTRVGRNGVPFLLYKLRTMVEDAEAETGAVWCQGEDDPRITPIGRFLRRTHIDEFPQLINVLLGHMSLVGPRPERPEIVNRIEWDVPHYRERLRVRPGIAGLAQSRLPPDSDTEGVRRKLAYDLYYVLFGSPWLDLRIAFATMLTFVWAVATTLVGVFRLPGHGTVNRGLHKLTTSEVASQPRTPAATPSYERAIPAGVAGDSSVDG